MKIGMSLACFYPEHPEDAIDRACDLGVDIAELFLNTVSELEDEYINDFIKRCDRRGLEIYSIHPLRVRLKTICFFLRMTEELMIRLNFTNATVMLLCVWVQKLSIYMVIVG